MVASGLPVRNGDKHPSEVQNLSFMDYNSFDCLHGFQIAHLSLDLMAVIPGVLLPHNPQQRLRIRMGVHLTTHSQSVITHPSQSSHHSSSDAHRSHNCGSCGQQDAQVGGSMMINRFLKRPREGMCVNQSLFHCYHFKQNPQVLSLRGHCKCGLQDAGSCHKRHNRT